jgi:DNA modification methylase
MTAVNQPRRKPTSTSSFGVGRREAHDASAFYERFSPPRVSLDEDVNPYGLRDEIWPIDARAMDVGGVRIKANSVALVVTSPPYFAGKAYEADLTADHIPSSYLEYLDMLRGVFAVCVDKLEPGGRIAVNVANLGRKPYRSLSADVIGILQDDLGLLLRGEIIWSKGKSTSGNCAWGSFQSAANPTLRDLTERVIIASKGRFDRAVSRKKRQQTGLPFENTIYRDDFMDWATDVWEIDAESATRVGHPAPFPVELPQRLIELYSYRDDLILDPFMGAGSSAVAAVRTHRHFVGFDIDESYVRAAKERVSAELASRAEARVERPWRIVPPATPTDHTGEADHTGEGGEGAFQARASREGLMAKAMADELLVMAGFEIIDRKYKVAGVEVNFVVRDHTGATWNVDVSGAFTKGNDRAGLRRADTLWKALGKASVLHEISREDLPARPFLLLTSDLPVKGSAGAKALKAVRGPGRPVFDAIEMLSVEGQRQLRVYAEHGPDPDS